MNAPPASLSEVRTVGEEADVEDEGRMRRYGRGRITVTGSVGVVIYRHIRTAVELIAAACAAW